MRSLPWWFWFAVAVVKFWFVAIPLAIALALAARYGAPWLGGMRWILIATVVLLALPFPAAALVIIYQSFDATRYWRTLEVPERVGGLPVTTAATARDAACTCGVSVHGSWRKITVAVAAPASASPGCFGAKSRPPPASTDLVRSLRYCRHPNGQ
jgi:hypothetical protein